MKKLLNEHITKDKVPCYYWSLKAAISNIDIGDQFLGLFGTGDAVGSGKVPKTPSEVEALLRALRKLKKATGVPCVFVLDDAQVPYLKQECYIESTNNTVCLFSVCSRPKGVNK